MSRRVVLGKRYGGSTVPGDGMMGLGEGFGDGVVDLELVGLRNVWQILAYLRSLSAFKAEYEETSFVC